MSVETFRPSRERSTPISVSFEFFPPKTEEMEQTLWASVAVVGRRSVRMPGRVTGLVIVCGAIDMLANALYLLATRPYLRDEGG